MIPNSIDTHIGQKLREIRTAAKMSQEQVGELIGVSLQQVQKYEICSNRISASKLYEFAKIFNKSLDGFFEDCVADRDFYNESDEERNLIDAFNKIKNAELRSNILNLVNSISQCQ